MLPYITELKNCAAVNMNKDYLSELRDKIAIAALPAILKKGEHLEFYQITDLCYNIADIMLCSRNKQDTLFNNIKEKQ